MKAPHSHACRGVGILGRVFKRSHIYDADGAQNHHNCKKCLGGHKNTIKHSIKIISGESREGIFIIFNMKLLRT